jgi:phage protein D
MADATNVPGFKVELNGTDLTERIAPRLVSLTITEKRGGEADQLDLVFHDSDGAMEIPKEGAKLQVSLGWLKAAAGEDIAVGMVDKGTFKVDEATWAGPPDLITIRGRSADLTGDYRRRRERTHRDTTIGAIVRRVAAAHGLTPHVAAELASIAVPITVQDQASDMALVRLLGRRHDAVAQIKAGRLIFSPIGAGVTASGRALPAGTLTKRKGDKYSYNRAARQQSEGAEARYHNQATGRRHTVRVGADGQRQADNAPASASGRGRRRVRRVFHSEARAHHAARTAARQDKRAAAEFEHSLALGRPDLYPERPITLSGFKPEIDAKHWIIAECAHSLTKAGGLKTTLKLEVR